MNLEVAPVIIAVPPPSPVPCLSEPAGLVVMGRDEAGRPHASLFGPSDSTAAERAAALMGFRTMRVTEAHHALASSLTNGRVFESGKAFVPFVSKQTYASLLEAAGLPDTPPPPKVASKVAGNPSGPKGGQGDGGMPGGADGAGACKRPLDFLQIGVGALVLATTGGPQEGWFEAVVRFTRADQNFVLAWRDWPLEPEFTRRISELALLHPGEATEATEADPS